MSREWRLSITDQSLRLFPSRATGYCTNRSDGADRLLHVKESNSETFTVHSSRFANSYTSHLLKSLLHCYADGSGHYVIILLLLPLTGLRVARVTSGEPGITFKRVLNGSLASPTATNSPG